MTQGCTATEFGLKSQHSTAAGNSLARAMLYFTSLGSGVMLVNHVLSTQSTPAS